MKFPLLAISNFGTFGEGPTEIGLADRGFFGIAGANVDDSSADSNGAGKSTIPDALCWAIYGTTARGLEGDGVVNLQAGKDCEVGVSILDGAEQYAIARFRKHSKYKNGLQLAHIASDGTITDLTQGTEKLTQAKIDKIMGCSYDVFRAAIYAGQENQVNIPALTDKALKMLVEEAGGITLLEECYGIALSEAKDAASALSMGQLAKTKAEADVVDASTAVADLKQDEKNWEGNRGSAVLDLTNEISTIKAEWTRRQAEQDKIDIVALRKEKDDLVATLKSVESERDTERQLQTTSSTAERERASLYDQAVKLKAEIETRRKQLAKHDTAAPEDCSECGQVIPDDPEARAAHKRAQSALIDTRVSDFKKLKERVVEATARATAASKALVEYRAKMTDVSTATAQLTKVSHEITVYDAEARDLGNLMTRGDDKQKQLDAQRAMANPFTAKVAQAKVKWGAAKTTALSAAGRVEEFEAKKAIADATVKVYGPAGVRAQELDRVTPYLNDRTAHYLSALSDGNITAVWTTLTRNSKGELKEKFTIDVNHMKGGASYTAISGGEKRKVRLACTLALQDLVASRATKPIDLWIGDEIDHALDNAGLERLFGVLETKARERGTVAIISHNDIKAWIRDVVTVEKKGGVSTLIEA